jgi:hypothetical protein
MAADYPWYCVVEGEELQQGDLIRAFPLVMPVAETGETGDDGPDIDVDIQYYNVVVMTKSCDLEQDKVHKVVLCSHVDLERAQAVDAGLKIKNIEREIQRGKFLRYQLLPVSSTEVQMPLQVLDFGEVHSVPKDIVRRKAKSQGKRLRLLPPYREHLAQAFARFYMRVALPSQPLDVTVSASSQALP